MGLGFSDLIWASLLFVNAIAILNEERFLSRIGWSTSSPATASAPAYDAYGQDIGGGPQGPGMKARLINLIGAVRTLMRIPLIMLNLVVILYELAFG